MSLTMGLMKCGFGLLSICGKTPGKIGKIRTLSDISIKLFCQNLVKFSVMFTAWPFLALILPDLSWNSSLICLSNLAKYKCPLHWPAYTRQWQHIFGHYLTCRFLMTLYCLQNSKEWLYTTSLAMFLYKIFEPWHHN